MAIRAFISRPLSTDSPLRALQDKIEWTAVSMLTFEGLPYLIPSGIKHLFFYSRKGVEFFFKQLPKSEFDHYNYLCMGPGTYQELKKLALSAAYIGTGRYEDICQELPKLADLSETLFVHGQTSRRSVEKLLFTDLSDSQHIAVYRQFPCPQTIPPQDLYIFTSPLNIESFLELNTVPSTTPIIGIGRTTSDAVRQMIPEATILTPVHPSEQSISELIFNNFLTN